jgi:hypothetical protein
MEIVHREIVFVDVVERDKEEFAGRQRSGFPIWADLVT